MKYTGEITLASIFTPLVYLHSPHIFCQNIKALNRYRPMNPHYQHAGEKKWVSIRGSRA